jgi:aminopeptidase N
VTGELSHTEAIATLPDAAIKAETWTLLTASELSNSKRLYLARGFMQPRQLELMKEYVDPYFDALLDLWSSSSYEESSTKVSMLYPRFIITQETLDKTDAWLKGPGKDAPVVLRRLVAEGRDSLARTLRIQVRDSAN